MKLQLSRLWAGSLALALLGALAAPATAQTTLWRVGKEDNSRAEFTATSEDAAPVNYAVPNDWATRNSFPEWSGVSNGNWAPDLNSSVSFNLSSVPGGGAEFHFKTLNASQHVPQLAVFSNGYLAGIINMIGTRWFWAPSNDGDLDKGVKFGDLYRVYIPPQFLQSGTNTLRLKKLEHPFSSQSGDVASGTNQPYLSFEYDYFKLVGLSSVPNEPIHSRFIHLGAQSQPDSGQFSCNDNDVAYRPLALKWLGLAYSGNLERATFWRNVSNDQPRRKQYLEMLRDLNMQVLMGHYSLTRDPSQTPNSNEWTVNSSGQLLPGPQAEIQQFWNEYQNLFHYYELSNEPTMSFSHESLAAQKAIADFLRNIKPAHVKIVAPGYNYAAGHGSPVGWDRDDNLRRDLETRVDATNGHSYTDSFYARDFNSFGETIDTYKPQFPNGFTNGFPKEFVNSEFGNKDGEDRAFGDSNLTEGKAQTFDRILRAHLAFGHKFSVYGANDDGGKFQLFDGALANPSTWTAHIDPTATDQTPRIRIFRQYALAYSTHGRPLPFVFTTPSQAQNRLVYVRPVDTSALAPLPGSGAKSDKILLSFVNFDKVSQNVTVRFTMPQSGTYTGERFGAQLSYTDARSTVSLPTVSVNNAPTITLSVALGPRESVQYILAPPANPLANGSFEQPTLAANAFAYRPSGALWNFTGNAGISRNGSAWNHQSAPEGAQVAFLQTNGAQGANGVFTQSVSAAPGTYKLTFKAARRLSQSQTVRVSVGSTVVRTFVPASSSWSSVSSDEFTLGSSGATLKFEATTPTSSGDVTAFIDDVKLVPTVSAGLVGWWKLDESSGTLASDSSGSAKNGTASGITWNPSSGKIGGAALFSGSSASITLPDNAIRGVGTQQTLACWFKTSSSGVLIGAQNTAYPTIPGSYNPILYISTNGRLYGQVWMGNNNIAPQSPSSVNDGQWHHAALVVAGNTQTLYLDGVPVGSCTGPSDFQNSSKNQFGIGYTPGWWGGNNSWMLYSGSLDDVRQYNRALSAAEVQILAAG